MKDAIKLIHDMIEYSLDQTIEKLKGPPREHIIFHNNWAATALDKFHDGSKAEIIFDVDGEINKASISWSSDFSKATMKEDVDMANHGGVAFAWFVMSVLMEFGYVEQSEIGDGVDYRFMKSEPEEDNLNFMQQDCHYVEVSGVLQETKNNTLKRRIKDKHDQINRGGKRDMPLSVIVTLFSEPKTVKEIHK